MLRRRKPNWNAISFAVLSVTIMLLSSISMIDVSADGETPKSMKEVVTGSDYGYVMEYNSAGTIVEDVEVWNNSSYEQRIYTEGRFGINSNWKFDSSTGLGPFNCFYAAINITNNTQDDSKERRISNDIGKVAYVLNPNDLTKTLSGTEYTSGIYNIMLVIPTVYWYSDTANGYLYMSSSKTFFDNAGMGLINRASSVVGNENTTTTYTLDASVSYKLKIGSQLYSGTPSSLATKTGISFDGSTLTIVAPKGDVVTLALDSTIIVPTNESIVGDETTRDYAVSTSYHYRLSIDGNEVVGTADSIATQSSECTLSGTILTVTTSSSSTVRLTAVSTVSSDNMFAYAHTFNENGGKNWGTDTIYPYLAIGFYEAAIRDNKLCSISGVAPANTSYTITNYRQYAQNNTVVNNSQGMPVGTYGLWNFYGVTLYRMMATTIIDQMDSQYVIGTGFISGGTCSNTGTAIETVDGVNYQKWIVYDRDETGSKSTALLIENSWGSMCENVDDACFSSRGLYTNNTLKPDGIDAVKQTDTGLRQTWASADWYLISGLSMSSETWGHPIANTGSQNKEKHDGRGVNDLVLDTNSNQNVLTVGGGSGNGGPFRYGCGLFCSVSNDGIGASNLDRGARLAYVMTADAVTPEYTVTVKSANNGEVSANIKDSVPGVTITLTADPESAAEKVYRLSTLEGKYGSPSTSLEFLTKTLTTSTFVMPECDVVITPTFEEVQKITVSSGGNGTVTVMGAYTSPTLYALPTAMYSVVGTMLRITDTILGSTANTYVLTTPSGEHSFEKFTHNGSSDPMSAGTIGSITAITAHFKEGVGDPDIFIPAMVGENNGATITVKGASGSTIPNGTVELKGVYYITMTDGTKVFGSLDTLNLETLTVSDSPTDFTRSIMLPGAESLYYAYAVFHYAVQGKDDVSSLGVLAPPL